MKNFKVIPIIVGILFLSLFLIIVLNNLDNNETTIHFEIDVIDIGHVSMSDPAKAVFSVENIGETMLNIIRVDTDCHCTNLAWDDSPIAPRKTTQISVAYDKNRLGPFQQIITVHSNAKDSPHILVFRGRII